MGYVYDSTFFDYIESGARRSARAMIPVVSSFVPVSSVLDVGCGRGVWIDEWRRSGVETAFGVDGDYVDRAQLAITTPGVSADEVFLAQDITQNFDLGRQFDLVQCLEVGEHIPTPASSVLVDNLVRHSQVILFSAAVPGQGGEHHVNEQPLSFWRDLFASREYDAFDVIRPAVGGVRDILPWYRYNSLLYVRRDRQAALAEEFRSSKLDGEAVVPTSAPLYWQLRCAMLRPLSVATATRLAEYKHRVALIGERFKRIASR